MMKAIFSLFLLTVTHGSATQWKGYLSPDNVPDSGKDWIALDNGIEFQPGDDVDPRIDHVRRLWGATSSKMDTPVFVDGTETYYNEYAQAWRLLGMYIDCHYCANGGTEAACIEKGNSPSCQRFLLWAAYVDVEYSGNGAGEYAYYDRHRKEWNRQACEESGSGRCVKMDCHEPNTHFKLLGIFKEPDYSTFLEQLYTYQGTCIWTDQEYTSMASALNLIPDGCTKANNGLYYDMKPAGGGSMTIGLYTDYLCVEEYTGSITVGETVAAMANDDDSTQQMAQSLDSSSKSNGGASWNEALDAFKICQPCKATDLVALLNHGAEVERDQNCQANNNNNNNNNNGNNQETNQCQQFRANSNMYTASYKDIMTAQEQGTVASVKMGQVKYGESVQEQNDAWKRNFLSALFLIASFCIMIASLNHCQNQTEFSPMTRPLMPSNENGNGNNNTSSGWRKRSKQPST